MTPPPEPSRGTIHNLICHTCGHHRDDYEVSCGAKIITCPECSSPAVSFDRAPQAQGALDAADIVQKPVWALPNTLLARLKLTPIERTASPMTLLGEDGGWYDFLAVLRATFREIDAALASLPRSSPKPPHGR